MRLVTVIITTRNRCRSLEVVLKSLSRQKIRSAFTFETIVVDNASTDQTRAVVDSFGPVFKDGLRCLLESQKGKAFAVNRALTEGRGDIFAFTDDDTILDESWLENIVQCFDQYSCDGVGGRILPTYPEDTPAWIKNNADILMGPIVRYDYGEEARPYDRSLVEFLGANYAFKKSLFTQYGPLRTDIGPGQGTLGEDTELVSRFFKAGHKLYYCGKALVWHPVEVKRMNLQYISQWNVGLGRYRLMVDEQGKTDPALVYWFGIPRYLIRQMLQAALTALANVFNKRKFLIVWIDFCRDWGKAIELRKIYVNQHHHSHA